MSQVLKSQTKNNAECPIVLLQCVPDRKLLLCFIFLFLFVSTTQAKENCRSSLNAQEIEHVKESKNLIKDIDKKSLQRTLNELENTECPPMNALIMEAMAKAYDDIVAEQKVEEQTKKEWLYSKIQLNMAYLQLTGGQQRGDSDPLNRLIRWKLKQYLPSEIFTDPRFFHEVKELLE